MNQTIALIGVPSSAGAHWPGQEKAPFYLRNNGLVKRLKQAGFKVNDYGDLPLVRFRPDKEFPHQQNLSTVVGVAQQVAEQVDLALQDNSIPLVVGGDCTVGLGVVAGFLQHETDLGLLYFDGHVDLNTPVTSPSGILDSMGIAHMIGEQGTADALSHIGARVPLMPEEKIVLFGYNPREMNAPEQDVLLRSQLQYYPLSDMQNRAEQTAGEALGYLERGTKRFVVHFDVDVIAFADLPIADVPQYKQGMTFRNAMACLAVFASSPNFGGLVITEFNPDHTDEEGTVAKVFINGLAQALAGKKAV